MFLFWLVPGRFDLSGIAPYYPQQEALWFLSAEARFQICFYGGSVALVLLSLLRMRFFGGFFEIQF
jgi:hypothetical protein